MSELKRASPMANVTSGDSAPRWPNQPYKGLGFYRSSDRPLYAGREADIRRCSALLMSTDTRTLILHGMTGCGKSSFLRAGLIPTVEEESIATGFLKSGTDDQTTVVFIRCTNAPVHQIADHLFELAQRKQTIKTPVGIRTIDLRSALGECECIEDFRERARQEDYVLIETLQRIAALLPTTLILILDQAEEVLTLNAEEGRTHNYIQFFSFLQDFNASALDVKLVISIRTEYFGRFVNGMHVDPRVRSDAKEYLLEDFTEEMLIEAIERPTTKEPILPYPTPWETYRFSFEPGLAKEIARDLVKAKQTSGVLPVMQIVCRSLFASLDENQPERLITSALYHSLGAVHGRIDQHISDSLLEAIKLQGLQPKNLTYHEEKWRTVLCKLVSVQQDGTVTTNVLPHSVLEKEAADLGIGYSIRVPLEFLAGPEVLLLRRAALIDDRSGKVVDSYSLGHDVLGLSLRRWQVTNEESHRHARQMRRFRNSGIAGVAAVAVLVAAFLGEQYRVGKQVMWANADRIYRQAMAEGPSHFQSGLLLAVAASDLRAQSHLIPFKSQNAEYLINSLAVSPDSFSKLPDSSKSTAALAIAGRSGASVILTRSGFDGLEAGYLVDLSGETPRIQRIDLPERGEVESIVWSPDGSTPMVRLEDNVTLFRTGSFDIVSVKDFLKRINGLDVKSALGNKVAEFGREEFVLFKCDEPGCSQMNVTPILRKSNGREISFEARPPLISARTRAGNRNLLVVISKTANGSYFHAKLINLDLSKEITLIGDEEKITGVLRPFSRLPEDASPGPRLLGAISFAPDDSAIGLSVREDLPSGALFRVLTYQPDWTSLKANSTVFSFSAGKDDSIIIATASGGAETAYRLGSNNRMFLQSAGTSMHTSSSLSLFSSSDLRDIEFVADRRELFGITGDGTILTWNTDIDARKTLLKNMTFEQLRARACSLAGRPLTTDEKAQFIGSDYAIRACGG